MYTAGNFVRINSDMRQRFATFLISGTLPVQLISFTADIQSANNSNFSVGCNWTTATEVNSSHFIVERSSNGSSFIPIGYVLSNESSTVEQHYSFVDKTPVKGISYYRLKLVDKDGKFTYSRIVAVAINQTETLFTIYPNPVKDEATMAIFMNKKQAAVYSIYDYAGRKLVSNAISMNEGLNTLTVPLTSLPAGIYIIKLQGENVVKERRFIKL